MQGVQTRIPGYAAHFCRVWSAVEARGGAGGGAVGHTAARAAEADGRPA